jgi:uncharacterized protein YxjI
MQYRIREHGALFTRDMVIEDHGGRELFRVHEPVVRVRDELRLVDAGGTEQAWIKDPVLGDSSTFEIYRAGAHFADVKTVATGNLLEGYDIVLRTESGRDPLRARGDIFERDFTITDRGQPAARVRKHGTSGLELTTEAGQDDVLLLSAVLAISAMADLRVRSSTKQN